MRTETKGAEKRDEDPHAAMRNAEPSDAPLAVVYAGIICCAFAIMIVVAVAAAP